MKKYFLFLLFFGCSLQSTARDFGSLYERYGTSFSWAKNTTDTAYVGTRCLAHYELLLESLPKKHSQMTDNERVLSLYLMDSTITFGVAMRVSKTKMGLEEDLILRQFEEIKSSYKGRVSAKNITSVTDRLVLDDFRFCRLAEGAIVYYVWYPTHPNLKQYWI